MDKKQLSLTKGIVGLLYAYYILIIIGSLVGIYFFFSFISQSANNQNISMATCILASFLSSALGNAIFYLRKLYKQCIDDRIAIVEFASVREIGVAIYFFARPLFACAFSLLVIISLKLENTFVSYDGEVNVLNFLYVCIFVSFMTGFGAGKALSTLEKKEVLL